MMLALVAIALVSETLGAPSALPDSETMTHEIMADADRSLTNIFKNTHIGASKKSGILVETKTKRHSELSRKLKAARKHAKETTWKTKVLNSAHPVRASKKFAK